jgi:large repetitive protein
MHTTSTRRWLATGAIAFLATLASATNLLAQTPTLEGTTITNTATASWTDANGNAYTPVQASASVIVGFLAAPDVASAVSVTPPSPSSGNSLPFTVTNAGNGVDSISVAFTAGTGVTITGFQVGTTTYTTLADLNLALSAMPIAAGGTVTVEAIYTVAPGRGGMTSPVTMTATSLRTPASSDASTTNVIPPVSAAVAVTPDGGTVSRLPSNSTQYSAVFTIANNGNASDTYTLGASLGAGSALTIVSVDGTDGTSGSATIAAGGSTTITVVYTVGDVAAGSTQDIGLTATSANDAAINDAGYYTVSVIRPALAITKAAFRDDQTTAINGTTDRVLPGDTIQYRITVTNSGSASASTVVVTDTLPSQLEFVSTSSDAAGWTIGESAGAITATLSGTLATSANRYFWVRVRVR